MLSGSPLVPLEMKLDVSEAILPYLLSCTQFAPVWQRGRREVDKLSASLCGLAAVRLGTPPHCQSISWPDGCGIGADTVWSRNTRRDAVDWPPRVICDKSDQMSTTTISPFMVSLLHSVTMMIQVLYLLRSRLIFTNLRLTHESQSSRRIKAGGYGSSL